MNIIYTILCAIGILVIGLVWEGYRVFKNLPENRFKWANRIPDSIYEIGADNEVSGRYSVSCSCSSSSSSSSYYSGGRVGIKK